MKRFFITAIGFFASISFVNSSSGQPSIQSATPDTIRQCSELTVSIVGDNTSFIINQASPTPNVKNVYIRNEHTLFPADYFSLHSATSLSASFTVPLSTPLGEYDIDVVQNSYYDTVTGNDLITVVASNEPVLTEVIPAAGEIGQELSVTIIGRNTRFCIDQGSGTVNNIEEAYLMKNNYPYKASDVRYISATACSASFYVPAYAGGGSYSIAVVTMSPTDTVFGFNCFSIADSAQPYVSSISPDIIAQGETLAVTVTGINTAFAIEQGTQTVSNIKRLFIRRLDTQHTATSLKLGGKRTVTGTFAISPDAVTGDYDLGVELKNPQSTAYCYRCMHVLTENNDLPVFLSVPDKIALVDSVYTYTIQIGSRRGVTITPAVIPWWLTFSQDSDKTATLSGTPHKSDVGSHKVILTAQNGVGPDAVQEFIVTVETGTPIKQDKLAVSANAFGIAPNPLPANRNDFILQLPGGKWQSAQVHIYDCLGNTIYSDSHTPEVIRKSGATVRCNLKKARAKGLGAGAYLAVITLEYGNGTRDVFKQHVGVK